MKMVEHQPTRKTIRFNETMDKEDEDRISDLQDCLLIDIISRLPETKEAIRTGTLSKRWQHLWPNVSNLVFKFYESSWDQETNTSTKCTYQHLSEYFSFVDKTLTQCRILNLNKFQLRIPYDISFASQVNDWLRYAVTYDVQELYICLDSMNYDFESEFVLDQFFFSNSSFTHLKLGGCVFNPTGDVSWSRLKSLYISKGDLDEDLIQNILSGCPLLETLSLSKCYGYRRLDITSKSVKTLAFSGYMSPGDDLDDIVEINAPYVLSLTIQYSLYMWKLLLLNVSSVVEAKLNYYKGGHYETTSMEEKDEMFKGFILKLGNVKELTIGNYCEKVFTRLKAKGLIFPSNIKYLYWCGPNEDEEEEDEDDEYGDEDDEYGDEEDQDQDQDQDEEDEDEG